MDSRIQLFLVAALLGLIWAPNAIAAQPKDLELEPLVVREPERREVKVDDIDSENFEIGAYGGILDIQDFGSNAVYGVRAAYHVTEDFFIEGLYGRSELGKTSFEKLSRGALWVNRCNISLAFRIFLDVSFALRLTC